MGDLLSDGTSLLNSCFVQANPILSDDVAVKDIIRILRRRAVSDGAQAHADRRWYYLNKWSSTYKRGQPEDKARAVKVLQACGDFKAADYWEYEMRWMRPLAEYLDMT